MSKMPVPKSYLRAQFAGRYKLWFIPVDCQKPTAGLHVHTVQLIMVLQRATVFFGEFIVSVCVILHHTLPPTSVIALCQRSSRSLYLPSALRIPSAAFRKALRAKVGEQFSHRLNP